MTKQREIKFDYITRLDGKLTHSYLTLSEIEAGINDDEDYEVIARRQYTDLKDKSGVEIYEGDIVQRDDKRLSIEWHPDKAAFTTSTNFGDESRYSRRPLMYLSEYQVIGNIYDNPELMESKI